MMNESEEKSYNISKKIGFHINSNHGWGSVFERKTLLVINQTKSVFFSDNFPGPSLHWDLQITIN